MLARLADLTAFSASRELALALEPSADRFWVERRQEETAEAERLLAERPEFSVRGARDVRLLARKAAIGGVLDPAQLLEVAGTLESGQYVGGSVAKLDRDHLPCPAGARRADPPLPRRDGSDWRGDHGPGRPARRRQPGAGAPPARVARRPGRA